MRTLSTVALCASLLAIAASAQAEWGWPGVFSKDSKGSSGSSSAGAINDSFWKSERPKFGSPRPKIEPPAPPRKPPVIFQKVSSGSRKVYNSTLGRVIPQAKPTPVSVTGRNTPWTRNRPKVSEGSSWWPWSKDKTEGPAKSTEEFFQLKRP